MKDYHDSPLLLEALSRRVVQGIGRWPQGERSEVHVVFCAHSLPARIIAEGDPYDSQLRDTARQVAQRSGLSAAQWSWSYMSAGKSPEPWLGPDLPDHLTTLAAGGVRSVLCVPVGFVADHVEVLYDIDIEAQQRARTVRIRLERPPSLNDDPPVHPGARASRGRQGARGGLHHGRGSIMKKLFVIGGGIAGLSAAWHSSRTGGVEITLVERGGRLGGKIRTDLVDGFILEQGPDSFLTNRPEAVRLSEELGISGRLVSRTPRPVHALIMHRHALFPLPDGFSGMVPMDTAALAVSPLLSEAGKRRAMEEPSMPAWTGGDDESVASFMVRRFGEEAFQFFVEPLVGGIHAGDAALLSLEAASPASADGKKPGRHHRAGGITGDGTGQRAAGAVSHVPPGRGGVGQRAGGEAGAGSRFSARPKLNR